MTSPGDHSECNTLENINDEHDVLQVATHEPTEGAVTIRINRPDARNALNIAVREALSDAVGVIDSSDEVVVAVLTGVDEAKAFAAGADVNELRGRGMLDQRAHSTPPRIYERISNCSKPFIAGINGHALGGGLELALSCDIRIAHERAKLGSPEINLGIIPGGGATQRLPRIVGKGQAMRLVLTGDLIEASEAQAIGLVDFVATDAEFDRTVNELVSSIASKSPLTVEYAKEAVRKADQLPLSDGIEYEAQLFAQLFETEDKNEGIDAFFEDRDPEWCGR